MNIQWRPASKNLVSSIRSVARQSACLTARTESHTQLSSFLVIFKPRSGLLLPRVQTKK